MKANKMQAHPEGGRYQEIYRSDQRVCTDAGKKRTALTHIYFSLRAGEVSKFHKVASDEVWNLYSGEGIELYLWSGDESPPQTYVLSAQENSFCMVVPAGLWQAAKPIGEEVLVGCSVAPGFEFSDFTLMSPEDKDAYVLCQISDSWSTYI